MLIYCDKIRKVIYVTLDEDLLADKAEVLQNKLNPFRRERMETLVLDLARVKAIDVTGLNTVIEICNLFCKTTGELVIENASYELKKLFRRMRVDGRLTISHTGWPS